MTEKQVNECRRNEPRDDGHLNDVPDGAGCTEIWEHLSDQRNADEEERAEE